MAQRELSFQKHLIDSYKRWGGFARKWSSEWQAGPPDLVCAHPLIGTHLVEVKHRPTFGNKRITITNPMDTHQYVTAKKYIEAGGRVYLAIVRGDKAINAQVAYFDPLLKELDPGSIRWYDYKPGADKFPIEQIMGELV